MNSILFEPAKIKGIQLKNRFVRSATVEGLATPDGCPSTDMENLYNKLAEAQVGLIITATTFVDGAAYKRTERKKGKAYTLSIDEDRYISKWKKIVDGVHNRGAKIAMQIMHPGRQESPKLRGSAPMAPSAVPINNTDIVPIEMTIAEINHMIETFAASCRRVKDAGFDAVQLHGGHGYLISNFISPYTNRREDKYGGSIKNRARFINDIIKRAREFVGTDFPIMIKMNCDDFIEGGLNKEEATGIAKSLENGGIDCIEVTGGISSETPLRISVPGINKVEQEAYFKSYSEALKKNISIPVILVGGLRTPEVMANIIKNKTADFISMSRPFIREPELVKRWENGDSKKARCISCNKCAAYCFMHTLRCYIENPLKED